MSEIVLSGTITAILPAEQGVSQKTGQPWVSQEFVLCHEQGQYPRSVCFRIFGQDKIYQAGIQMGEYCTVHLNIDARASQKNGKYFNSIDCWKVDHQQPTQGYQQMPQQGYQQAPLYQQQPAPAPAPFPPQQPTQQQQAQSPFPPQQAQVQQPAQTQQQMMTGNQGNLPFPPAQ